MIREQEMALLAARQFESTVEQISDAQWTQSLPSDFKTYDGKPTTVRETINYHAYDDAWIPDMLAGKTMAEVGEEKWKGDLLGDRPAAAYQSYNWLARAAIEQLDDPDRTVHCSFGDFSARDYLLQIISFRALRSYDLARSLGFDSALPDELVAGIEELLVPHADEWRAWGVYSPAVSVPETATRQTRVLGELGFAPPTHP